jgi:quercetin dioxygenase-like cupin family protein
MRMEPGMTDSSISRHPQHVYDFDRLDTVPANPTSLEVTARRLLSGPDITSGKSSTVGAVLRGEHIICTLGRQGRGTGAKAHSHPNEQFNFILHGMMMNDIEGDRVFAGPGSILHTPGMAVHTGLACPDEDLVFLAVKDTRHGIVGPPVDGRYDGPNCFPGFGSRTAEPAETTAQALARWRTMPPGPGVGYVYDMVGAGAAHAGPTSASLAPMAGGSPAPGVQGRVLTGERIHVGVLRLEPGATLPAHLHENEQFTFVVEGSLQADLDGTQVEVPKYNMLHIPSRMRHELRAPTGALILLAQDARSGYSL